MVLVVEELGFDLARAVESQGGVDFVPLLADGRGRLRSKEGGIE